MNKRVCVVTVTYGDRRKYLSQVLDSCLKNELIDKIIVIDNASACNKEFFENFNSPKIKWIRMNKNTGSAGGYHAGIKEAFENTESDFIWLLDDDNVPEGNCLKILIDEYFQLKKKYKPKTLAVQARRPNFISHARLFSLENPEIFYKRKNSFLDFSLDKLFNKINFVFKGRKIANKNNIKHILIKAPYTQYGGLLLDKKTVKIIGYPDSKLYLYADDSEYTYRITKNKGSIFIIRNAIVNDIDLSWNNTQALNKKIMFPLLELGDKFRIYYSVRNQCYFENKNFINHKFIHFINKFFYLSFLFIFALFSNNTDRFKIILKAIKDSKIIEKSNDLIR